MSQEKYTYNPFAEQIYELAMGIEFGKDYGVEAVTSKEIAQKIANSPLLGLDPRAKLVKETGYASVFQGLDFDSLNLRSQAFAIVNRETGDPVGVMSFVIANQEWISQQRYFYKTDGGVYVCDFGAFCEEKLPNFLIIPAWTKVLPEYLGRFAIPGFRGFNRVINKIQQSAPNNTWMEAIAQGDFPFDRRGELETLTNRGVGTFIAEDELPFDLKLIGKTSDGASSSAKMSLLFGLHKVKGIGSSVTLGPSFIKKVK